MDGFAGPKYDKCLTPLSANLKIYQKNSNSARQLSEVSHPATSDVYHKKVKHMSKNIIAETCPTTQDVNWKAQEFKDLIP